VLLGAPQLHECKAAFAGSIAKRGNGLRTRLGDPIYHCTEYDLIVYVLI
jgi:hypothetical protein